jgi:hypothetical protein
MMDSDALGLFSISLISGVDWNIFRDFLDSGHPLALDGQRHATAASACLKIIFICDQAPHSWRTLRVSFVPNDTVQISNQKHCGIRVTLDSTGISGLTFPVIGISGMIQVVQKFLELSGSLNAR